MLLFLLVSTASQVEQLPFHLGLTMRQGGLIWNTALPSAMAPLSADPGCRLAIEMVQGR